MFRRKKEPAPIPTEIIVRETEYRPCYVHGKKALFHRWANDARATLPRGVEPGENARYFQFRSTMGIVEYEDGAIGRVYPNEVKFSDGGHFREYAWLPQDMEDDSGR